jgi:hypothetical protein
MRSWHIEETRQHIARIYGRPQLLLARPSLRSVDDRLAYARIHYQDSRSLLKKYVKRRLTGKSLLMEVHHSEESEAEFNLFIRKIGAHVTVSVQSIHAIPDILAHAIYYSLGLNLSAQPLVPRAIRACY